MDRIYVQTNDAERNEVVAFDRGSGGELAASGRFETGGRGSGVPHLASQSSIVLDGDRLLVANAGSDELSLFRVTDGGLQLASRVPSGGSHPTSVAVRGELVYVLNNGAPAIAGFSLTGGMLSAIEDSTRPLAADADPAQIAFSPDGRTLVVTERGTTSISTFTVDDRGLAERPADDRLFGRHSLRLRLRGRLADRHRGLRRRDRRGGGLVLFARRGPARACQRVRGGHAERGLLGGSHARTDASST